MLKILALVTILCGCLHPSESYVLTRSYPSISSGAFYTHSNKYGASNGLMKGCSSGLSGGLNAGQTSSSSSKMINRRSYAVPPTATASSTSTMAMVNMVESSTTTPGLTSSSSSSCPLSFGEKLKVVWDFTRPHTIIGSFLSLTTLFMYAVPSSLWKSPQFIRSLVIALIPSLLTNLYITGLNQITDVDIDIINKPYLPIPSGKLSKRDATILVVGSLLVSLLFAAKVELPLSMTILASAILGTVYSLPPFRLKRFPMLAAFCILTVRGSVINLGFLLQAKEVLLGQKLQSWNLNSLLQQFPDSVAISAFFAAFGLIIALMKDTPDVAGDTKNNIPTFSVRLGAKKMFG